MDIKGESKAALEEIVHQKENGPVTTLEPGYSAATSHSNRSVIHGKCQNCGSPVFVGDEKCLYCGSPNLPDSSAVGEMNSADKSREDEIPLLLDQLKDPNWRVRLRACEQLKAMPSLPEEAIPALNDTISDANRSVASAAMLAMKTHYKIDSPLNPDIYKLQKKIAKLPIASSSENVLRCQHCDSPFKIGEQYCRNCGRNLPTRVCPYCQHTIPKFEDPCHFCHRLEPAEQFLTNQPNTGVSKFYLFYLFIMFFVIPASMIIWPDAKIFGGSECDPYEAMEDPLGCVWGLWSRQTGVYLFIVGSMIFGWMGILKLRRDQEKHWD